MNITYNNISSPEHLITFTDVPNILKVTDYDGGYKARYTLTFVGNLYGETTADSQWYITLFGDTISNVLDANNAVNKTFHVSTANTSTAASVARALRNCPNLAANFIVEHSGTTVEVTAREVGSIFQGGNYFATNIASAYMGRDGQDGSASSSLNGALIDVDVTKNGEYVTTLEKNFYNGEAAFDVSPVLTTIAQHGKVEWYEFKISSLKNGEYALLGNLEHNYVTVGYMCNQGYKYLILDNMDRVLLAQNVSRGGNNGYTNKTMLYTYAPNIRLSLYHYSNVTPWITIRYLDSAYNFIGNETSQAWPKTNNDALLYDYTINLNQTLFNQAFYVVVQFNDGTDDIELIYKVIKPLKATEYWQRIYWRNSYGGVSFFDFTGQRSETRNLELSTYQKNIFGYYDSTRKDYRNNQQVNVPYNVLNKSYDNTVDYSVTLKSHLFEHDGKYIFNDLIQSSEVWTEINGEFYEILLESVSVEEQNMNNIYEATVKYKYSQHPSLL